jgi:hypothetical protein
LAPIQRLFRFTAGTQAEASLVKPIPNPVYAESVILFVLEGIGQDSLKAGPCRVLVSTGQAAALHGLSNVGEK